MAHGLARGQAADPAPIYRAGAGQRCSLVGEGKAHGPEEEEKAGAY